jgi:hypothetical protein
MHTGSITRAPMTLALTFLAVNPILSITEMRGTS